jgi:hypothetical protein
MVYRFTCQVLANEEDNEGHHESIDGYGFGEAETKDSHCADGAFSIGVAADGLNSAEGADTEADAGADAAEAHCETRCDKLRGTTRVGYGLCHNIHKYVIQLFLLLLFV